MQGEVAVTECQEINLLLHMASKSSCGWKSDRKEIAPAQTVWYLMTGNGRNSSFNPNTGKFQMVGARTKISNERSKLNLNLYFSSFMLLCIKTNAYGTAA